MTDKKQPERIRSWAEFPEALADLQFYYPFDAVYENKSIFHVNPHVEAFFKIGSSEEQGIYAPVKQIRCSSRIFRIKDGEDRVVYTVANEIYTESQASVHSFRFQEKHPIKTVKGLGLDSLIVRNANGLRNILHILGYPPLIKRANSSPCIADMVDKPERYFSVYHLGAYFGFVTAPVESSVR